MCWNPYVPGEHTRVLGNVYVLCFLCLGLGLLKYMHATGSSFKPLRLHFSMCFLEFKPHLLLKGKLLFWKDKLYIKGLQISREIYKRELSSDAFIFLRIKELWFLYISV